MPRTIRLFHIFSSLNKLGPLPPLLLVSSTKLLETAQASGQARRIIRVDLIRSCHGCCHSMRGPNTGHIMDLSSLDCRQRTLMSLISLVCIW
jgi:hypothetical protein